MGKRTFGDIYVRFLHDEHFFFIEHFGNCVTFSKTFLTNKNNLQQMRQFFLRRV